MVKTIDTQSFDRCGLPPHIVREHTSLLASLNTKLDSIAEGQQTMRSELREDFGKIYEKLDSHSKSIVSTEGEVQRLKEDKKAFFAIIGTAGTILFELASKLFGGK
ncbi:MAG: hypothetical protein A2X49_05750 [Lentisphaerae bacterium GWF2_52_8]|nr:MAG: hypothetical protein A2X49_05750 [Lentisphaerae bacterium GWF2_52_8]